MGFFGITAVVIIMLILVTSINDSDISIPINLSALVIAIGFIVLDFAAPITTTYEYKTVEVNPGDTVDFLKSNFIMSNSHVFYSEIKTAGNALGTSSVRNTKTIETISDKPFVINSDVVPSAYIILAWKLKSWITVVIGTILLLHFILTRKLYIKFVSHKRRGIFVLREFEYKSLNSYEYFKISDNDLIRCGIWSYRELTSKNISVLETKLNELGV